MRYRDLKAGVFIPRDPAGFVGGPNVYTYVRQNPWTKFDPLGLFGIPTMETQKAIAMNSARNIGGEEAAERVRLQYDKGSQGALLAGGVVSAAMYEPTVVVGILRESMKNPVLAYGVAETVTTGIELATGYDGPPLIPGPGDPARVVIQNASEQGVETLAKNVIDVGGDSSRVVKETTGKAVEVAVDTGKAPSVIYRKGSAIDANLTPRPQDKDGLSTAVQPPSGKFQVIDPSKFNNLEAIQDGVDHASISPLDKSRMQEWIDSRSVEETHEFTEELRNAIIRIENH